MPLCPQEAGWTCSNDLQQLAWDLYAGPHTTKFVLEDTFNHLRHVSTIQNKGRMYMAKPTQWFYSATAPGLATAQLNSPEVQYSTYQTSFASVRQQSKGDATSLAAEVADVQHKKTKRSTFKPGTQTLPSEFGKLSELLVLKREWKAAGYMSNRVASAAVFYLLDDAPNNWQNAAHTWSCALAN